ncbi:MAG: D-alanine--D-alanine ligase [Bacteroidota bacterium]|nr:D-alanine--D-alanine ligase [Bacteroidota bacterium]
MKRIAVVMGGYSSESEVSLKSGKVVLENLTDPSIESLGVIIDRKNWNVLFQNNLLPIDQSDFSFKINNRKLTFDGAFIAVHGVPGENGELQKYFDDLAIPYTSSGEKASKISFDKGACNKLLKEHGVHCAVSQKIHFKEKIIAKELIAKIGLPCFVKPNSYGSSYGVSKVYEQSELQNALDKAFKFDQYVLVESFLQGTEVTCGIHNFDFSLKTLPITEIVSDNDFFDYEAKYEGKSNEITPARISEKLSSDVASTTKKVYQKLNLNGIARVDFIICDNLPYVIEVNTVPGLSKESIIPQQVKEAGISLKTLFSMAVRQLFD